MKILQVAPLWESVPPRAYGGTEAVVHVLVEELVRRGHEVTLCASGDSQTSARLQACYPRSLRTAELENKSVYSWQHAALSLKDAPDHDIVQVAEQLGQLGRHRGVRLVPIYGGQPIDRQLRALRHGVQVIVATPGRLMDHMRRGTVDLTEVTMLVLDEADQRHRCAQSPLPHSDRTSHSASLQQDVRKIPAADAGRRMPRESH
jgi:DEAD/DEAH box helicase